MRMSNQSGLTFVQSARTLDFTRVLASNSIGSVQSGLTKCQSSLDSLRDYDYEEKESF